MKFKLPKISSFVYYTKLNFSKVFFLIRKLFIHTKILKWIHDINKHNSIVLVGANVLKPNGVDFHIHAIQELSQTDTCLIPSDTILKKISSNNFFKN